MTDRLHVQEIERVTKLDTDLELNIHGPSVRAVLHLSTQIHDVYVRTLYYGN